MIPIFLAKLAYSTLHSTKYSVCRKAASMSFYNVLSDSEKLTMGPIVISKKTIGLFAFDGFSANDMLHFSRFRALLCFFLLPASRQTEWCY